MVDALLKQVKPPMLALLLVSLLVLSAAAGYLYLLKKPLQDQRLARQTLESLNIELQTGLPLEGQIEAFQSRVTELNRQLYGNSNGLPLNQMIAQVIGRLDEISTVHGIKLISVEPANAAKVLLFQEISFHVVVVGSYFKLFDWLAQIERDLGPFVVQEFELSAEPDSASRRFVLTLAFYQLADAP